MKTITIVHSKGGVGKSTLTWNIAIATIGMGYSVAIVDLDIQQHTVSRVNEIRSADGREALTVLEIHSASELAHLISASQYDFVFIDVGGYDYDLSRTAIALSDRLVVPISDSATELLGFVSFTQFLSEIEEHSPVPPLLAVINAVHPRASRFGSIFGTVALWPSANVAMCIIRRRMIYAASMGNGFGVTEMRDRFPAAASEIGVLTLEVIS